MKISIDDIELRMTCGACPEQYDAFYEGKRVGYLRLRHGYFRVDYPKCGGATIFEAEPNGDGIFEENEREHYLASAKIAIINKIRKETRQELNKFIDK